MYFNQDHQPVTRSIPEVIPDALQGSKGGNKNQTSKTDAIALPTQTQTTSQSITSSKPTVPVTLAKPHIQPHTSAGAPGKINNIAQIRLQV